MAKTFEDYQATDPEKAREERTDVIERVAAAMDRTEILQDVARRVAQFVSAYEEMCAMELNHIREVRGEDGYDPDSRRARVAANMEQDLQNLAGLPGSKLLLDDVKVLLDQFPQKDV